jgi:Protein of unknown function DUF72.
MPHWSAGPTASAAGPTASEADDAVTIGDSAPAPPKRRDVYCYFDNDAKVKAPFDALRLYGLLADRRAGA